MIWRIRDRRTFAALRARGTRAGAGTLTVVHLREAEGDGDPPRVAFAVGRPVGGAVVRNRVRRRLRAVLAERRRAGRLPSGAYLVIARPEAADLATPQLAQDLDAALQRIDKKVGP